MMYESPIKIHEVEARIVEDITKAMDDYILAQVKMAVDVDKEELIKALSYDRQQYDKGYADGYANAKAAGKWIHIRTEEDGNGLYECSECHKGEIHVPIVEVKYCWNCGAKMEGGEQE